MESNPEEQIKKSHLFQPGQSGNPGGRPKGQRDYATIYKEALKILANKNNTTEEALEAEMVANAAILARKGDYRFYKDILDRIHGTAITRVEQKDTSDSIKDITPEEIELAKQLIEQRKRKTISTESDGSVSESMGRKV